MSCNGQGYIICRCYGDGHLGGVCPLCGGDGPCPGCADCDDDVVRLVVIERDDEHGAEET